MEEKPKSRWQRFVIVAVLLFFAAVPLTFIAYGAAGALGGLVIVGVLGLLQWPLYVIAARINRRSQRH